jgi:hypothetical protein
MNTSSNDGWLSRSVWRRLIALRAAGRIGGTEFQRLKLRLTRVRRGPISATDRPPPRLVLLRGGDPDGPRPRPLGPRPREAA